jgi:hypothetical protein
VHEKPDPRNNVAETPVGRNEMGCGIKNSLGQNIVAKAAMGYAFSAVAPSRYSSDSLTIIDIAVLLLEDGYFLNQIIT